MLTVLGLLHPAESVLLPLNPDATTTIVAAGANPVPEYDRVTVRWLPSTMLNPVTVTLAIVLAALKEVNDPLGSPPASGPAPLKPGHCPFKVLRLFVVDGFWVWAWALANANAAAPALSPAMITSSTTVRVATPLLTVG